jgi:hypothetical protein
MVLRLTALTDSGREITNLNVPMPDAEWALLTDEQITARKVTPYLDSMRTDTFLWEGICRSGQGVITRNRFGPV